MTKTRKVATLALCLTLSFSALPAVNAQELNPVSGAEFQVESKEVFQACSELPHREVPTAIALGESLGEGITEKLTPEIQNALQEHGRNIPEGTSAIRHLEDGRSVYLNSEGENLGELTGKVSTRTVRGILPQEAKDIIGACLGFSWESGPLAEVIFRQVTSVSGAIKFIIRRIGLGAAIGCVGGIIWHYI